LEEFPKAKGLNLCSISVSSTIMSSHLHSQWCCSSWDSFLESSRVSNFCAPTQSSHAHKGALHPKLSCSFDL
jgi:hypothetical protein